MLVSSTGPTQSGMDGWMDEWMDGCMHAWMVGCAKSTFRARRPSIGEVSTASPRLQLVPFHIEIPNAATAETAAEQVAECPSDARVAAMPTRSAAG